MSPGFLQACCPISVLSSSYLSWLWPGPAQESPSDISLQQKNSNNLSEALMEGDSSQHPSLSEATSQDERGTWDTGMTPPTQNMSSKETHTRVTGKRGQREQALSQGIELKATGSNFLLGQAHLQDSGQFVQTRPGSRANSAQLNPS